MPAKVKPNLDCLLDMDLTPDFTEPSQTVKSWQTIKSEVPVIPPTTELPSNDPDYVKDKFNNVSLMFEGDIIKCVIREDGTPFFAPRDVSTICGGTSPHKSKCTPDAYTWFWYETGYGLFKVVSISRMFRTVRFHKSDKAERLKQFIRDKFLDHTIGRLPVENNVVFQEIPGYKDYAAGDNGSIWSRKSGEWEMLKPQSRRDEYLRIALDGKNVSAHTAILLAFRGNPEPGQECRHLNDVKHDNRLVNLVWGTPTENQDDRRRNDPRFYDPTLYRKKLTLEQVREIKNGYEEGVSISELSRNYKIDRKTTRLIVTCKIWKHVT